VNFKEESRYSPGLSFLVSYTIQKNLESGGSGPDAFTQNGGTSIAMDSYNLSRERGVAPIDVRRCFGRLRLTGVPYRGEDDRDHNRRRDRDHDDAEPDPDLPAGGRRRHLESLPTLNGTIRRYAAAAPSCTAYARARIPRSIPSKMR
jgi:hypothetical protein